MCALALDLFSPESISQVMQITGIGSAGWKKRNPLG